MPKPTLNRVLVSADTVIQLDNTPESYTKFLSIYNALRFVQATKNEVVDGKKVKVLQFNDDGTPKMGVRERSGYDQYWNNDGFSNPMSPENLTPQGVGKLLAKLFEVAHTTIHAGGPEADEMKAILAGALAFNEAAATLIPSDDWQLGVLEQKDMEAALATLNAAGSDAQAAQAKLAAYLQSKGVLNPSPVLKATVATTEATPEVAAETTESTVETLDENTVDVQPIESDTVLTVDSGISEPSITPDEAQTATATATATNEDGPPNDTTEDIGANTEAVEA